MGEEAWTRTGGAGDEDPGAESAAREKRLAALVGKRALVGVTVLYPDDTVIEQFQVSGLIVAATLKGGIDIASDENDGIFNQPPAPDAFHPAQPGRYVLRGSGRTVIDPDLVSTWDFRVPPSG